MMLSIFSYAYWPFVCLIWRNIYSDPLPVFKFLLLFIYLSLHIYLYIFLIQVPNQKHDLQKIFPFCGVSFHFLMVSFETRTSLILIMSIFLVFSFMPVYSCNLNISQF